MVILAASAATHSELVRPARNPEAPQVAKIKQEVAPRNGHK
jgi:hypothetical protein